MKHNFGEKDQELGLPVWQSPKFIESRAKAIELIDSGKYGLTDQNFWILMNKTKSGKMAYTGLIISHNGCLKINDSLPIMAKLIWLALLARVPAIKHTGLNI